MRAAAGRRPRARDPGAGARSVGAGTQPWPRRSWTTPSRHTEPCWTGSPRQGSRRERGCCGEISAELAGTAPLLDVLRRHRSGEAVGMTSVCSAHPLVLEAAVAQAVEDRTVLLVEATSNQVDQYGGYTGMRPADFRDLVLRIAERGGLLPSASSSEVTTSDRTPGGTTSPGRRWRTPTTSSAPMWKRATRRSTWTARWPARGTTRRSPTPWSRSEPPGWRGWPRKPRSRRSGTATWSTSSAPRSRCPAEPTRPSTS